MSFDDPDYWSDLFPYELDAIEPMEDNDLSKDPSLSNLIHKLSTQIPLPTIRKRKRYESTCDLNEWASKLKFSSGPTAPRTAIRAALLSSVNMLRLGLSIDESIGYTAFLLCIEVDILRRAFESFKQSIRRQKDTVDQKHRLKQRNHLKLAKDQTNAIESFIDQENGKIKGIPVTITVVRTFIEKQWGILLGIDAVRSLLRSLGYQWGVLFKHKRNTWIRTNTYLDDETV